MVGVVFDVVVGFGGFGVMVIGVGWFSGGLF